MAKTEQKEPKYECSSLIDGTKVWYYFNPPHPEDEDPNIKAATGKMVKGIILVVVAIALLIFNAVKKLIAAKLFIYVMLILVAVGIIMAIVGFFKRKAAMERKDELISKIVSDEEYERMEKVLLADVKNKGLEALNLDESEVTEADPIFLHRYVRGDAAKLGEDGKWRSSKNVSTILFFGSDALYVYTYKFSTTNKTTDEESLMLYYTDIVSVMIGSVDSDAEVEGAITLKKVSISATGGQTVSYEFISEEKVNRSLNAMRSLFAEKKRGN